MVRSLVWIDEADERYETYSEETYIVGPLFISRVMAFDAY